MEISHKQSNSRYKELPELTEYVSSKANSITKIDGFYKEINGVLVTPSSYQITFSGFNSYPASEEELKLVSQVFKSYVLTPFLEANPDVVVRLFPSFKERPGSMVVRFRATSLGEYKESLASKFIREEGTPPRIMAGIEQWYSSKQLAYADLHFYTEQREMVDLPLNNDLGYPFIEESNNDN